MTESVSVEVHEVLVSSLRSFHNHPFFVPDGEDNEIKELVESIKANGVLTPLIVRRLNDDEDSEDSYEIISGHRRRLAALIAKLEKVPVIVKDYADEDEAMSAVIEANRSRRKMLISDKARILKARYEILRHQGRAIAEKDGQEISGISLEILAKDTGDSPKTVQRCISLTNLIPEFLRMIDTKKLASICGVEISALSGAEQMMIYSFLSNKKSVHITLFKAQELKRASKIAHLTEDKIKEILSSISEPSRTLTPKGITISADELKKYFNNEANEKIIKERILSLLEKYGIKD